MIEVDTTLEEGVVAVRFRGAVTNREFTDLAETIANSGTMGGVLIYLDWLRIDRWTFSAPKANDVTAWRRAGKMIERAAIVHDHRMNRQAAWLAAVLRGQGVKVRSWRPQHAAAAARSLHIDRRQQP
jgi:hypothetical protein